MTTLYIIEHEHLGGGKHYWREIRAEASPSVAHYHGMTDSEGGRRVRVRKLVGEYVGEPELFENGRRVKPGLEAKGE